MTQVMFQQTQILQALLSNQQTGLAGRHSKLADFLRTRPLTFAAANEPLEAEDWLRDTEKKLRLARCSDKDKVDFATHQLKGAAAAWWENYLAARGDDSLVSEEEEEPEEPEEVASTTGAQQDPTAVIEPVAEVQLEETEPEWQPIPWVEFKAAFRTNFVPAGTMRLKKNEFRALKQNQMTVNEYLTNFNQLARYAPSDVADEEEKIDRFMEGMREDMRVQLILHDFSSFHQLVNKALVLENEKSNAEVSHKRKMAFQMPQGGFPQKTTFQGSSSFQPPVASSQGTPVTTPHSSENVSRAPRSVGQPAAVNPIAHLRCSNCGEKGHFANRCPQPATREINFRATSAQGQTSAASKSHQTSQASRAVSARSQSQNQGQVNHVAAAEIQAASGVLRGVFSSKSE